LCIDPLFIGDFIQVIGTHGHRYITIIIGDITIIIITIIIIEEELSS